VGKLMDELMGELMDVLGQNPDRKVKSIQNQAEIS
jgi:hypothetical protein